MKISTSRPGEEVAIVGMGCRFPGGAANPEAYWDLLKNGIDATGEVPAERWSLRRFYDRDAAVPGKISTRRGGYLRESIRWFDARFFGISPREAAPMDPQQRLLLEVAWEAFEDAGIVPAACRGSLTGVYIGGFTLDNKLHLLNTLNREAIGSHTALSATLVMLSNRLSYVFDLRGPSLTVDTACSSSLVALHLAVQALRQGECEMALVGGVNLMFRPAYSIAMSKGGFLSPDGRSKSFDARADGYGRGEGAGVIVLKPLRAALADGDPIRAVVVATGVNQDGKSDGITQPNPDAQVALVRDVCTRAGVDPGKVDYVEAHGTGTIAGDAAEARSLSAALARARPADAGPLVIGSAKSNLGHLEAAAGVAGLIKTALTLEKRAIPPSIHFRQAPAELDLAALRLEIPTRLRPWREQGGRALAAVNSFGYGGTNAHVLLAAPPAPAFPTPPEPTRPLVIPLSARSDESLMRQLRGLHQVLAAPRPPALPDLGYTLARRRSHHDHRVAIVATTTAELRERLRGLFAAGNERQGVVSALEHRRSSSLAFVYTGMGPQSWGMGMELLADEPIAAAVLERCDAVWLPLAGWSLATLFGDRSGRPMREPRHAQPANLVLQVILTELARAYGLAPAAIVGHSTGEIAAAWAAGVLDLETALRITWHRSRLQQTLVGTGRMLAVGLSADELGPYLPGDVEVDVAAINGPRSVTLAGSERALETVAAAVAADGVFHSALEVEVPYHGRGMDAVREAFLANLGGMRVGEPELPLYSTVTGARVEAPLQDAEYWWRNLRQPVLFAAAAAAMVRDGHDLFLEMGPHPVLAPAIVDGLAAAGAGGRCLAGLRRSEPERAHVAGVVATAFVHGAALDWSAPYPSGSLVALPTYPWDREELWTESRASRLDRLGTFEHPILSRRADEAVPVWDGDLSRSFHAFLQDHAIQGEPVFPAAGYLELALAVRRDRASSAAVEDLEVRQPLETFGTPILRLHLDTDDGQFAVYSRARVPDAPWHLNATGRLPVTPVPPRQRSIDRQALEMRCSADFDAPAFYSHTARLGLEYGPAFRCLRHGWIGSDEALLRLALADTEAAEAEEYYVHPVLLDGVLQAALALELAADPSRSMVSLPVAIGQCRFHRRAGAAAWCHALRGEDGLELVLFDDTGEPLVELFGLRTRALPVDVSEARLRGEWLYTERWELQRAELRPAPGAARWLVFADSGGIAEQLRARAAEARITCLLVEPAEGRDAPAEGCLQVRRGSRTDLERLLEEVGADSLAGVLYLWGLDVPGDLDGSGERVVGRDDVVDLLYLVQALDAAATPSSPPVPLVVCTAGTQIVARTDKGGSEPGQHALWGAVRTARRERPERRFQLIDLATRLPFVAAAHLVAELRAATDEPEVAFRGQSRYVLRIVRWGPERYREHRSTSGMTYVFESRVQGGLLRRGFVETARTPPAAGEVEIAVATLGLGEDDRRHLHALDVHSSPILESQCTGRITARGAAVEGLHEGQMVMVLDPVAVPRSHLVVAASSVLPYPDGIDADDGGAVFDWLDAAYALFELGALRGGHRVLVHHADTGFGLAAVRWALGAGATVMATVAAPAHGEALATLACRLVGDTRSLAFCDQVRLATGGLGADLVISPLTGEGRAASLDLVREDGVFIDVSPRDRALVETVPLRFAEAGIRLVRPDRARSWRRRPEALQRAWARLAEGLPAAAEAVPVAAYSAAEIEDAFLACRRGDHLGRLVIEVDGESVPLIARQLRPLVDTDAGYLVTGGFSGLGLETVRWLCAHGARHVAVLSRSGPVSAEARAAVAALEAEGVRVHHATVDITDRSALDTALARLSAQMPPLRGVVHSAAVLADADIEAMDAARVDRAMGAKALGALHLHRALAEASLDFFICHASISATLGNPGQFAYAAGNAFLHGLTAYRRARGLPATCVRWGPVAEVGMAARDPRITEHLARAGMSPLPLRAVFAILEEALIEDWGSFDAVDVRWASWNLLGGERERCRYSELVPPDRRPGESAPEELRRRVFGADPQQRRALLFALVVELVAAVVRMSESRVDPSHSLAELGADSIMTAEVAQAIFARTGIRLRTLYLARGPSLAEVAGTIEEAILAGPA